ncbi:MAG: DNA polymerase III subunit delta [Dehalococcoidia bacterium]
MLYGDDDFSLRETLAEIKEGLGDETIVATNTTILDGQNIVPKQLIATCDTIPFLAAKRLVIVEGLLSRLETRGRGKRSPKLDDSGWLSLKEYVQHMPESTDLVLIDGPLKKSNPLLKALVSHAIVKDFQHLKDDGLRSWMRARAKKVGCTISPPALSLLANLIGSNLWLLSNEIDKLCLYAQGRTVEQNDVRLLVADAREASVFSMIDAILERKYATTVRLLHSLEDEGAAPPYLLFMITRQFRTVMQAKDLLQQKRKVADIGNILGITSGYALRKTLEQAKQHSMERLEEVYRKLLETDISIKTGRLKGDKGELALDLLVSELSGKPSSPWSAK